MSPWHYDLIQCTIEVLRVCVMEQCVSQFTRNLVLLFDCTMHVCVKLLSGSYRSWPMECRKEALEFCTV